MKRGIILGLILLLLVNVVSASLVFNELESVYNLGDVITLHATIGSDSETEGFLRLYLMCQGDNKDFYLSPLMLGAGDERTEEVSLFLSRNFLKETKGECRVRGEFAGDGTSSTDFEISNEILIDVHMNNTSFDPGQSFDVRGKVTKKMGKDLKGGWIFL